MTPTSTSISPLWRAPRWYSRRRLPAARVPVAIRRDLLATGSLTALVQSLCEGRFAVRVLRHERRRVALAERRLLGISDGVHALTRQVFLCCDTHPWVFAHSVIPDDSLRGPWRRLARLGSRPLGAALFADPAVRRGPVEIGWLSPGDGLYDSLGQHVAGERIWGRRSVFWLHGKPLMVCEFFLPAFARLLAAQAGDRQRKGE